MERYYHLNVLGSKCQSYVLKHVHAWTTEHKIVQVQPLLNIGTVGTLLQYNYKERTSI